MFDSLSYDDFAKIENTKFKVLDTPEDVELELFEVSERKITTRQEIFSLWLRTPLKYLLEQGVYRLNHAELGDGELFIVPVEKTETNFLYQAVFNRLVKS